jgi:uncharacterized membrane protein
MERGGVQRAGGVRGAPRATLAWLERELGEWQAQGRLDAATAAGIRALYVPVDDVPEGAATRRLSLGRLVLGLGGCFVGVGLLWLVAANLDQLSPLTRFTGVVVLWLTAVAGAELLAVRRAAGPRAGDLPRGSDAVVATARVIASLAFGAVVFQAAQSVQVPAWSSALLGCWAAGALVHAYLFAAVPPLVVGIATGTGWCVWAVSERLPSVQGVALALLVAACLATAAAVAHAARSSGGFAPPWRASGALLALTGLFLAALPRDRDATSALPTELWLGGAAVLLVVGGAAVLADPIGRAELGAVVVVLLVALLVVRWQPPGTPTSAELSGEALLRAVVAIVVYLLAALWFAALGVLRDSDGLTRLATAALVVFTVVQSFAVFEPILSGAALFLVLGAVLVATGYVVDRGRRRLVADVKEVVA